MAYEDRYQQQQPSRLKQAAQQAVNEIGAKIAREAIITAAKSAFAAIGSTAIAYIGIGIVAILAIVLLINLFQTSPQQAAQLTPAGIGGSISEGPPLCDPQTDPECAIAFCDPTTQDCRWPTPCGCIIQGPYSPVTHGSLNAIDITFSNCSPGINVAVTSTHTGIVTKKVDGIADGTWITGSYGNELRLQGIDENNNPFTTLYTHLSNSTVTPKNKIDTVGEPIGLTDDTGHSYGEHLHYEYQGGGSINQILPIPVPEKCNGFAECGSICW